MTGNARMDTTQPVLLPAVAQSAKSGIPLCSPGLRPLLTDVEANEDGSAVRAIARSPGLLREAELLAPLMEAVMAPATDEELITVLIEESVAYDLAAKGLEDREWAAMWSPYLRALDGMPLACLRDAFIGYTRNEHEPKAQTPPKFYPRPGQIYALAAKRRDALAMMRHRIRAAVNYRPPVAAIKAAAVDGEEFRKLLGGITAASGIPRHVRRPVAAVAIVPGEEKRGMAPPMLDDGEAV